jgi:hypothetical protein
VAALSHQEPKLIFFARLDDIESTSWANIEANIAILCACLPIFRRPLALLFPRLFSALGDHPAPASNLEGRDFSHVETNASKWVGDGSNIGRAPHESTWSMDAEAVGTRNEHGDEFISAHVEDIKIELG